jgi:hypothetical protein
VGRPHNEPTPTTPLTDQLVPRRVRNQVREPFERDLVAVAHELGDRFRERDDLSHGRPD